VKGLGQLKMAKKADRKNHGANIVVIGGGAAGLTAVVADGKEAERSLSLKNDLPCMESLPGTG
jgi:hypothetical protein